MLGSLQDAEDALQETLLRAWRGLGGFETSRALRPWLYQIATNASLDLLAKRPKRTLRLVDAAPSQPADGPGAPLVESIWIEPYPDEHLGLEDGFAAPEARYEQRESVELAFIAALQHLPARQRAVLILREVLGFSARRSRSRSTRRPRRSTARSSGPVRRSTRRCPTAASKRRCARSATNAFPGSSSAMSRHGKAATST
jgi:RNA polymerase sigma factor (sigma-70 family)